MVGLASSQEVAVKGGHTVVGKGPCSGYQVPPRTQKGHTSGLS